MQAFYQIIAVLCFFVITVGLLFTIAYISHLLSRGQ